jgi:hypothetical protein
MGLHAAKQVGHPPGGGILPVFGIILNIDLM